MQDGAQRMCAGLAERARDYVGQGVILARVRAIGRGDIGAVLDSAVVVISLVFRRFCETLYGIYDIRGLGWKNMYW